MITRETLCPHNRDKIIGNSLYRICRKKSDSGKWYIHETYNDGNEWSQGNAHYDDDVQKVLDIFNSITSEKEVVSLRLQ